MSFDYSSLTKGSGGSGGGGASASSSARSSVDQAVGPNGDVITQGTDKTVLIVGVAVVGAVLLLGGGMVLFLVFKLLGGRKN